MLIWLSAPQQSSLGPRPGGLLAATPPLPPDAAAAADGDPGEPEPVAVDLVGGAAVLLDVLVAAVLVGEAAQERLARQAPRDVVNTVFASSGLAV